MKYKGYKLSFVEANTTSIKKIYDLDEKGNLLSDPNETTDTYQSRYIEFEDIDRGCKGQFSIVSEIEQEMERLKFHLDYLDRQHILSEEDK